MRARRLGQAGMAGEAPSSPPGAPPVPHRREASTSGAAPWHDRARSREEAEERYAVAHDAWIAAMRGASSGKPADLATLAIAQAAYEAAVAERDLWASSKVAIPVHEDPKAGIDVVIGQEEAWRRVRAAARAHRGLIGRMVRRLRGRS